MKRILLAICLALLMGLMPAVLAEEADTQLPGTGVEITDEEESIPGPALNKENLYVYVGRTSTLKATPSNGVKWRSTDKTIATVNGAGKVTGVRAGQCTVIARLPNGGETECTVHVRIPATKVTVDKKSVTLNVGKTRQIVTKVYPAEATSPAVQYKSSDPKVAAVDSSGLITALKKGTANITVTAPGGVYTTVKVKVQVAPSGVKLNMESTTINKGKTKTLKATVSPKNAYSSQVTWKSSDTKVATVNANGVVTGKGYGECVITATTANGLQASCTVKVRIGVNSVKVSPASATINQGKGKQLTATISPSNASNQTVTWKSSNTRVATVDENGYVTAVGKGTAVITATTASNKRTSTCKVTVRIAPESVTLNKTSFSLYKGKTLTLKATVYPKNAYSTAVTWKSSNTKVATVNAYGLVRAVNAGECDITATAAGGKIMASSHVTVKIAVSSVSINKSSVTLVKGGEGCQLTATVKPSNATDKSVSWESSNSGVASVDENGYVTVHDTGTATITVSTGNGKTAAVKVKVVEPASSISLNQTTLSLKCGKNSTLKATVGPKDAGDKSVKWSSSDKEVAVVTSEGKVYAKSAGTCIITASANGGVNLTATCQVTVTGTPNKFVALTFDGGPNKGYTTSILNTLDTYGVKATFFMLGSNVTKNPDLAKRVYQAGHEIGNHSYTHPRLTSLSLAQAKAEITKTDEAIYKAIGVYPTVIRPPYGAINRSVANLDKRAFVNWNVVSHDATYADATKIANITLNSTGNHNCAIILCHDTNDPTAQATKTIVPTLLSRGYTFVTVSEMMEICGYEPGDSVVFSPALK